MVIRLILVALLVSGCNQIQTEPQPYDGAHDPIDLSRYGGGPSITWSPDGSGYTVTWR